MTIDPHLFRSAMSRFATGVTVITSRSADGRRVGLTANSVASVSLEPPLVLFCLGADSELRDVFRESGMFAINVLNAEQEHLSRLFADSTDDKWTGIAFAEGRDGCPLLAGALAHIECRTKAVHEEGDHDIFVGRVVAMEMVDPGSGPLVYFGGGYRRLAP